ncbi:MAG TPA: cysteine desulfurase [Aggregatilinea sp.]|uniref:cysteine desulfurase n=1 Tax=Aggregatilinea sp. TaxID=2806333 RepID=UPI002BD67554|nr:cysteine desulfurase [Aggregatilinea sp.]HML23035.1 cysteine desulfurase [Aggregatilinea sp.]
MSDVKTSPLNIDAIRDDFPILNQEVHPGKRVVFLDSAASSQKPRQVIDAMSDYYETSHANVHRGIHVLSERATNGYEGARVKVKEFINAASAREIIYTRNTTESINLVSNAWGRTNLGPGDVVVLTEMEHHSNIVPWQILAAERGFTIRYVPVTDSGELDLDAYTAFLRDEPVKLVGAMHVSNMLGTVNPVEEMIAQAHAAGALFVLDGAQSVPHLAVDVQALDVDFLAFSGHKMAGPTGIGILYGKRALLEAMPPFLGGGDMIKRVTLEGSTWNTLPHKFEAGTPAIAEAIGMGAAVDYLRGIGMDNILAHERILVDYALDRLAEVPGLTLYGPDADKRNGVATFTLKDLHAHDLAQLLDAEGVAIRAGHHCAMPLHQRFGIAASARASFYLYNTTDDVDALVDAIEVARKRLGM